MMNLIGISGKIGSGKDTIGKIIQYLTEGELQEIDSIENFIIARDKIPSFPYNWKVKKFAYKLKQVVSILTGISVEDLEKEEVKNRILGGEWNYWEGIIMFKSILIDHGVDEKDCEDTWKIYSEDDKDSHGELKSYTVRKLLQTIGTNAIRNIVHPSAWINALFSDYESDVINAAFEKGWIITDLRFPNEAKAIKDRGGALIRVNRLKTLSPKFTSKDGLESVQMIEVDMNPHPSETALDNYSFDYTINNNSSIQELVSKVKEILIKEKII